MNNMYELGSIIQWAGHRWVVVNQGIDLVDLALDHVLFDIPFGRTNQYVDSILADYATEFEHSLPTSDLHNALLTNVLGVTSRIYVPTTQMIANKFDRFKTNDGRVCVDVLGESAVWWTASPTFDMRVWCISSSGYAVHCGPTYANGFRPFVSLKCE